MSYIQDADGRFVPEGGFVDSKDITRAPAGMLRVVEIDSRDHSPSKVEDCADIDAVQVLYRRTTCLLTQSWQVHDEHNRRVNPFPPG